MRLLRAFSTSWSKCFLLAGGSAALCAIALIVGSHVWIRHVAAPFCHDTLATLPAAPVALVLGCSPFNQGRPNLFFEHRMDAAAELFRAGLVKALIVSGDNSRPEYDEPTAMKQALVQRGVPASVIHADFAGFRTLDSVLRAQSIFAQTRFILISQRFHNERAVFLARRHGIEATALNAADVPRHAAWLTQARELLARVQAVLDVTLLNTQPKFGGPPIVIPPALSSSLAW